MPICGAKRRDGKPCTKSPVRGKTRCERHGGKSTGSPTAADNPLTHGIYGATYTDEEKALYHPMLAQIGHIEEEITVARIQLFRARDAKKRYEEGKFNPPITEDLEEIDVNADGTLKRKHKKVIRKHPNYDELIDRFLARIGNLEKIRHEMNHNIIDDVGAVAKKIKQALTEIDDSMESEIE